MFTKHRIDWLYPLNEKYFYFKGQLITDPKEIIEKVKLILDNEFCSLETINLFEIYHKSLHPLIRKGFELHWAPHCK